VSTSSQLPMRLPSRERGKHVGRQAHVLLAAGDDDAGIPGRHGLGRQVHGFQAAAADLVDGERGDRVRQTAGQGGLARRVLAHARLKYLAEDDLVDLPRLQIGPRQQSPDHMGAQLTGGNAGQRAVECTDRSTSGGDDDYIIHVMLSSEWNAKQVEQALRIPVSNTPPHSTFYKGL
jgi:hypothetical protein